MLQWQSKRTRAVRRRTQGVRSAYAERAQHRPAHLFRGSFPRGLAESFGRFSRGSSISQILGLSESRRQSPGWHDLDGNLAIWVVRARESVSWHAWDGNFGIS